MTIPFTGLKKQYNNLREEILSTTDKVYSSGQLMNGPYTRTFESWLADYNSVKYAVTCHSGTGALEIIANFYRNKLFVNPPRVLIPTLTYAATANAFAQAGWDIYFIDTDRYGIIDLNKVPDVSFHAIVLVGLYGASISKIPSWHNVLTFEDAAQHWLNGHRIGVGAAISFDPMKNLPCYGNGGAIVTNSAELKDFAISYRDNGKPNHTDVGTNSRMSELDCALMMVKANYIDSWQYRRKKIAEFWLDKLKDSSINTLIDNSNIDNHTFHKFVIEVDHRDYLKQELLRHKIETKIHYAHPLHEVGLFSQYNGPDMLSCASSLARRVLSLPIYPELTDSEVEYIIDQVLSLVE